MVLPLPLGRQRVILVSSIFCPASWGKKKSLSLNTYLSRIKYLHYFSFSIFTRTQQGGSIYLRSDLHGDRRLSESFLVPLGADSGGNWASGDDQHGPWKGPGTEVCARKGCCFSARTLVIVYIPFLFIAAISHTIIDIQQLFPRSCCREMKKKKNEPYFNATTYI